MGKLSIPEDGQIIFLNYGNKLIIPVYGENYAQDGKQTALKKLYSKYGSKVMDFSLAPQSDFQAEREWPEPPFLNVLPVGQFVQTKDNWLGYIHPFDPPVEDEVHKDRQKYTEKLIALGNIAPLIVKGKIIKEDDAYSMLIFASHSEIDSYSKVVEPKRTSKAIKRNIKKTTHINNKDKFYEKWWFWVIVAFLILAIVGKGA